MRSAIVIKRGGHKGYRNSKDIISSWEEIGEEAFWGVGVAFEPTCKNVSEQHGSEKEQSIFNWWNYQESNEWEKWKAI